MKRVAPRPRVVCLQNRSTRTLQRSRAHFAYTRAKPRPMEPKPQTVRDVLEHPEIARVRSETRDLDGSWGHKTSNAVDFF